MDGLTPRDTPVGAEPSTQIILVLRNLLGERYPELGHHVKRVAHLCESVAPEVGLADEQRESLSRAAFLHDIGKLSLPESMLQRPGPLTQEESRMMRLHTDSARRSDHRGLRRL